MQARQNDAPGAEQTRLQEEREGQAPWKKWGPTTTRAILIAGLLAFAAPPFAVAQNQLFVGTWKADVAKSRYEPGASPRSEVLQFELVGDGIKVSLDGVNQQGPYHSEAVGKFDGVDVPVVATPARRARFTYAFRRVDERTWEIVIKVNGAPQLLVRNVVAEDGRTMRGVSTVISRGHVNQDVLYERQSPVQERRQ